jgi:hypothetical protein
LHIILILDNKSFNWLVFSTSQPACPQSAIGELSLFYTLATFPALRNQEPHIRLLLYLGKLLLSITLMSLHNLIYSSLAIFLSITLICGSNAATPPQYDSPELAVGLMPRTPLQIAAFYEARGFNKSMIEKLKQQCFITVWIHNKSSQVIWLDLAQLPLAHQSTFRWTLLPEILDFQPDEREGGNIVLPRDDKTIDIQATFPTGVDKSGMPITIRFNKIQCAKDP